jgi:hypothetical protein
MHTTQRTELGLGDRHPLAGTEPQQVDLELGEGCQDAEEHLAHRVGRIVRRRTESQRYTAADEVVADRAGIGHGPGEPVELGDDQGVPQPQRGERLVQPGRLRLVPVSPWSR